MMELDKFYANMETPNCPVMKVLSGYFGLEIYSCHPALDNLHLNTLRKAWEIAEKIQVVQFTIQGPGAYQMHDFQGGKAINLDLEAEWQRVLEVIQ